MHIQLFYINIPYSFNKLLQQKEELEQKQLHLLQVVESERTSRWQYAQQCDELSNEVKKLRTEVGFISSRVKLSSKHRFIWVVSMIYNIFLDLENTMTKSRLSPR